MKILIGSTELEVTSCSPLRHNNGKIELVVEIPAAGNNEADLRALFKNNTEDILKYADDGTAVVETLSGFRYSVNTAYNENKDAFLIYAEGVSEAEFQNGRLRQQIADQNKTIAGLNQYIAELQTLALSQNAELLNTQMAVAGLYEATLSKGETSDSEASEEAEITEGTTETEQEAK